MATQTELFEEYRNLLFSVAYRMLGSVADAEDAVQDAWIRWSSADRSQVLEPRAYLVRITTNLAMDRLRSAQVRREAYVGTWLPEPLLTTPDIADDAELAESVSMALLVVLEALSPLERAVFVLHEVFGFPLTEIAETLERSPASIRQLATRARKHVDAGRSRFESGKQERRAATERFLEATMGGDINQLMEILAPDVTLWSDGGGKVRAPLRNIVGAEKVARWLVAVVGQPYAGVQPRSMRMERIDLNGMPGLVVHGPEGPITTVGADLDEQGRIRELYLVANPDKLRAVAERRPHPLG